MAREWLAVYATAVIACWYLGCDLHDPPPPRTHPQSPPPPPPPPKKKGALD